jgi:hypothetical protein
LKERLNAVVMQRSKDTMNPDIRRDMTRYCRSHPRSPSARRHPKILIDHGRYVALLGRSINRGILGFGSSVASALHAFDDVYKKAHPHARF